MWATCKKLCKTCKTLFIEQDISVKKYIAFSELVILAVDRATKVTKN